MIDPILSLALSMHSNRGVYALLLGSGVSRSAGIPTGWEVVLDLIRKVARMQDENSEPDPEVWYTKKYGESPTYSGLLNAVAKSQAERTQLLRSYFEPSDEDRIEGRKVPTAAHRAIAQLVKLGIVRVLVTTNFDRLIEQALQAEGIEPAVIASADDADGALPLAHSQCVVIKVHGDYLDLRTRNTPAELESYDQRIDQLLDRVLDEFGVLVCGWSAEWDTALCNVLTRSKARRFSTYWTSLSDLGDTAKRVATHRAAEVIKIKDAETFFPTLAEKILALDELRTTHPLSIRAAISQAKRYLAEPQHQIRLNDLLMEEVQQIIEETGSGRFPPHAENLQVELIKRIQQFESLSEVGAATIATGCYWGNPEHYSIWNRALTRLANRDRPTAGSVVLIEVQAYPAILLQYAAGIGAAAAGNLSTIFGILTAPQMRSFKYDQYLSAELELRVKQEWFQVVPGLEKRILAMSERLFNVLRAPLKDLIPSDDEYTEAFDRFEALQSVECAHRTGRPMAGIFMYRYYTWRGGKAIATRDGSPWTALKAHVLEFHGQAEVIKSGFAGGSLPKWSTIVSQIEEASEKWFP